MKKLNTSDVSTTNGLPLKSGSLVHIQSAYTESIAEAIKAMTGDNYNPVTPYRLTGLINTAGTVSAGSIFYNGEVFLVDSFSLPTPANASIDTTYFTAVEADPVEFTDGTPRSIREIRKIVFGTPAGLGFNFAALTDLSNVDYVVTNSTPSPTVLFDKRRKYYRSIVVTGETTLTINLSAAGVKDGTECMFLIQSNGGSLSITHSHTFDSIMGVGGYTNPMVVSVASNAFYVIRYTAYRFAATGNTAVSVQLLEAN